MEGAVTRLVVENSCPGNNDEHTEPFSPITSILVFSTSAAACGSNVFGIAVGHSSPAETGIVDELGVTTSEYSIFGSILTIGVMLAAIAMAISEIFCILGWLPIIFAKDAFWLYLGRFSLGCGIWLLSYVLPINLGKALTFLVGSLVNWRTLAIKGIIPCPVQLRGLYLIPESPRWLAKIGRVKEFESSLQCLRGKSTDISKEAADVKVGVGLMVFQQFGGLNGFVFYTTIIYDSAGICSPNLLGLRPHRIVILLPGSPPGKDLTSILVLLGVLVYLGSFAFGMGGIPWVIMSEILPINIKGSAGSLVNLICWIGSSVIAYTFNFLFEWSPVGTFIIYAAINSAGVLFIAKLVPETSKRISLAN
ncbi:hypothetical protein GH714_003405 [Hevea brasiliensis]|uniref:Major facilitator superfamily (MFS) profile domain-containing protein n=1 Tax=Hevea brasiliensis TaxID=3981 RepID=A0A6A6KI13_HEVBR|nr:hypothetical protein GH714_003405 [Hevea brasiliensis]